MEQSKKENGFVEQVILGVRVAYEPKTMVGDAGSRPIAVNGPDMAKYLKDGGTEEKFHKAIVEFLTKNLGIKPPDEIISEEDLIGQQGPLGLTKKEFNILVDYIIAAVKKEVLVDLKRILEDMKLMGTKPGGQA